MGSGLAGLYREGANTGILYYLAIGGPGRHGCSRVTKAPDVIAAENKKGTIKQKLGAECAVMIRV